MRINLDGDNNNNKKRKKRKSINPVYKIKHHVKDEVFIFKSRENEKMGIKPSDVLPRVIQDLGEK